jgi:DNA ligase D-like protein (predicted 3'-phosphoesterase)
MPKKNVRRSAENAGPLRYVIQEHFARTHHFDFRLEKDGAFKSWAVPKGLPTIKGKKHLAVQVEDHPLKWGEFEGEIPPGEYGAGAVRVWDMGTYETLEWESNRIGLVVIFTNTLTYFSLQICTSFGMVGINIGGNHAKTKPI